MKAVAWHGKRDVRVEYVPDPTIQEPSDAIVRITTTAIYGSDLHLYEVLGPFMGEGDILGHEPMRMGQANVRYWTDDIMPLLIDTTDPLGVEDLATHKLPLDEAPHGYEIFQKKQDGAIKILLHP